MKSLILPVSKPKSTLVVEYFTTRWNCDKLSGYFSIFEWQNWPKHWFCQTVKCQMALYGITVNFTIQKWKSKHLVCLSFLWRLFFYRRRENILHIFRAFEFLPLLISLSCYQPNSMSELMQELPVTPYHSLLNTFFFHEL